MPPKKAKTKAKPPVKAAPQPDPPASVTTRRGKEIETTAALGRPRRESAVVPVATETAAKAPSTMKRGRPAKTPVEDDVEDSVEPPKKRGRPAKTVDKAPSPEPVAKKARGRPPKAQPTASPKKSAPSNKPKAHKDAAKTPAAPNASAPRKRGRPPFGGQTTKIASDDVDAADQLEDELVDAVQEAPTSKRKAPAKKQKTTKAAKSNDADAADLNDNAADQAVEEESGNRYWLLKAEQEDREVTLKSGKTFNTKFTIDDLRAKMDPEPWDGVRNVVARNNMRAMKQGDLGFFYASGGKQSRKPGITGIIEIVREHEPDMTAFDENAYGFVEQENNRGTLEDPKWSLVHVAFKRKLAKPVTLAELQKYSQGEGVLSNMQVIKSTRTSVTRVSQKEWDFITENLIEGYEDDLPETDLPAVGDNATAVGTLPTDDPTAIAGDDVPPVTEPVDALPTIEQPLITTSEAITTDTVAPAETVATSRPASRAGSKAPSRAGSKAPNSRAASMAPSHASSKAPVSRAGSRAPSLAPRPVSRGRSRTPNPRAGSVKPQMTAVEEGAEEDMLTTDQVGSIIME